MGGGVDRPKERQGVRVEHEREKTFVFVFRYQKQTRIPLFQSFTVEDFNLDYLSCNLSTLVGRRFIR